MGMPPGIFPKRETPKKTLEGMRDHLYDELERTNEGSVDKAIRDVRCGSRAPIAVHLKDEFGRVYS
jgi:hypothetical protein